MFEDFGYQKSGFWTKILIFELFEYINLHILDTINQSLRSKTALDSQNISKFEIKIFKSAKNIRKPLCLPSGAMYMYIVMRAE